MQELTKKLAQYWQSLVPLPQSALDTIAEGGYYTVLIQDRLRLLAFNSDYGYTAAASIAVLQLAGAASIAVLQLAGAASIAVLQLAGT